MGSRPNSELLKFPPAAADRMSREVLRLTQLPLQRIVHAS
jgi:hypothetical protein